GGASANRRLNSWKEVAEYLSRDVTTVMRWEKEKGLPVRRAPGAKRSAVVAYSEEIDRWLVLQQEESPGTATPAVAPAERALQAAKPRGSWYRSPGLSVALLGLLILILGVSVFWTGGGSHQASGAPRLARPLRFVRMDYEMAEPRGLAAADFNGDKKIDLVAAGTSTGETTVLVSDGYGGFSRRLASATQLGRP